MMIAPPQGLACRGKSHHQSSKKKVFRRMTPAAAGAGSNPPVPASVPGSTKHTGMSHYKMFGSAKKCLQVTSYSTKYRPSSAKNSENESAMYSNSNASNKNLNNRSSRGALIQAAVPIPSKLKIIRKPSAEPMLKNAAPVQAMSQNQPPNLRDLLKEVYQVIKNKKKTSDGEGNPNKVSVDTIVVVNTPQIMQSNIASKGGIQKKPPPICIDLRSERKFYLKERSTNAVA